MKSSPRSPCADFRRTRPGFTLIELLTAIAVLSLLFVMLGQMLGFISGTWKSGQRRVNNFTKARVMLDLLAQDLQGGVFRSDLAAFPDSQIAFYTQRPAVPADNQPIRNISLVQYTIDTNSSNSTLQRGDYAIKWSGSATDISFSNSTSLPILNQLTARDTAPGIVGFKIVFISKTGTQSTSFSLSNTRAFGITLAVIDDQTIQKLTSAQINSLRTALASATSSGNNSVKADWENYLNTSFNWSAYPRDMANSLRIFERYVYLPISTSL
jgi:prepilin-type N-terminal cleavage/methylation domain-containing protein